MATTSILGVGRIGAVNLGSTNILIRAGIPVFYCILQTIISDYIAILFRLIDKYNIGR